MITLAARISQRTGSFEAIYLDVNLDDVPASDATAVTPIFTTAKQFNRHVGMVMRQYSYNTYFTYDPEQRSQLEVQLLGPSVAEPTEIHVQAANVEVTSWNKY